MIRTIRRVTLFDKIRNKDIRKKSKMPSTVEVIKEQRLRWFDRSNEQSLIKIMWKTIVVGYGGIVDQEDNGKIKQKKTCTLKD